MHRLPQAICHILRSGSVDHHAYFWLGAWRDAVASLLRATAPLAPHPVNALLNGNLLPPQTIVACISACVFCLYILMAVSVSMCIYILSAFGCSKSETNRHLQAIYASHPIPPKTVLRSNITDYVRCYTNYEPRSMRNMTLSSLVLSGLQPGKGLQNSGAGTLEETCLFILLRIVLKNKT